MTLCANWGGKRLKISQHFFVQSEVIPKPSVTCAYRHDLTPHVKLHVFTWNLDKFIDLLQSVLCN